MPEKQQVTIIGLDGKTFYVGEATITFKDLDGRERHINDASGMARIAYRWPVKFLLRRPSTALEMFGELGACIK